MKVRTPLTARLLRPLLKTAIINSGDKAALEEYGGTFKLSDTWIYQLLHQLKLSCRRATTAAQKLPADWQLVAKHFALRYAF